MSRFSYPVGRFSGVHVWPVLGVPRGCINVERLNDLAICEMCESAEIRYAHHMQHPNYESELIVGCHCAEDMEQDYAAPRARETRLRSAIASWQKWLSRKAPNFPGGNFFLKTRDGFHIVVWQNRDGTWSARCQTACSNGRSHPNAAISPTSPSKRHRLPPSKN